MATKFYVYKTQFHGGGLISRHRSELAAEKAAKKWRGKTDCTCGCAVVTTEIPADAGEDSNPYRAAA